MPSAEIFAIAADSTADFVAFRHKRANLSLAAHALIAPAPLTNSAYRLPGCFEVSTALVNNNRSTHCPFPQENLAASLDANTPAVVAEVIALNEVVVAARREAHVQSPWQRHKKNKARSTKIPAVQ
jgi:hypothetical protein